MVRPIFMIYAYRDPVLLGRTVRRLFPHPVHVHIDRKVDATPFLTALGSAENVHMVPNEERILVNWGGYSQVQAILTLMRRAISSAPPHDYVVMLSGQDYPLRPPSELVDFLSATPGRQHIRFFDIVESKDPKYLRQIDRRHHRDLPVLRRARTGATVRRLRNAAIRAVDYASYVLPAPSPPNGLRLAFGPTHFAITVNSAQYVLRSLSPEIERFFSTVFCPEEKLVQTLIANSPFASGTPAGGFEPYVGPGNWRYSNLHHIDASLKRVFTLADRHVLQGSDAFFLRKLDSAVSSDLLDWIDDERLRQRN